MPLIQVLLHVGHGYAKADLLLVALCGQTGEAVGVSQARQPEEVVVGEERRLEGDITVLSRK
jgi:hypothetical protein